MDAARECYYTMRELVLRHPGGRSSEASFAALRKLCQLAGQAAGDAQCSALLATVEQHAADLFSGMGSGNWVRRQILRQLEEFRARLSAVEALGAAASGSNSLSL